jgi:hypothetical protein
MAMTGGSASVRQEQNISASLGTAQADCAMGLYKSKCSADVCANVGHLVITLDVV